MDLQQECDAGICSPPHWEAIWRQQARSAGVSTADGNMQAMSGAPPIRSIKSSTPHFAKRLTRESYHVNKKTSGKQKFLKTASNQG